MDCMGFNGIPYAKRLHGCGKPMGKPQESGLRMVRKKQIYANVYRRATMFFDGYLTNKRGDLTNLFELSHKQFHVFCFQHFEVTMCARLVLVFWVASSVANANANRLKNLFHHGPKWLCEFDWAI